MTNNFFYPKCHRSVTKENAMSINRRNFLRHMTATSVGISSLPLLNACTGLVRSDVSLDDASNATCALPSTIQAILALSALAPSSHNSQPWQVDILSDCQMRISVDTRRALTVVDPDYRELHLSVGAFVENLVSAASAMDFLVEIREAASSKADLWQAEIHLQKGPTTPYPIRRLKQRRTRRSGFASRELDDALVKELSCQCHHPLIYLPRGTQEATRIGEAALSAFVQQTANDAAQAELASWIRFSDRDARRHRDGMTPEMMDIDGIAGFMVRHFYNADNVLSPDFRKRGIDKTARQIKEGAGWLLITSPGETGADLIEAGRRFERLALLSEEYSLALHPLSQALETRENRLALANSMGSSDPIQLILRCGFVDKGTPPVSLRRPVPWFTNLSLLSQICPKNS
jgi:hypothetical protein